MKTLTTVRPGGSGRAAPGGGGRPRPRSRGPLLVLAAALALAQQGCQTFGGGCGTCGGLGLGNRLNAAGARMRDFGSRVFNHKQTAACCDGGILGSVEAPIDYGTPVLEPAPAVVPGAVIPAPAEPAAPMLEPLPQGTPLPGDTNGSAASGATKSAYQASRPRVTGGRAPQANLARALMPDATTAGRAPQARPEPGASDRVVESGPASPLDDLPPLELHREIVAPDPVPAEADPDPAPVAEADPDPAPAAEAPPPDPADSPPAPAPAEAEAPTADSSNPPAPAATNVAPGSWRFANVEPKLAGGSAPGPQHLAWLAEKGYRTLLDLRAPADVRPEFIAEASRSGFRYIILPISVDPLSPDQIQRFHAELAQPEARPLFFFDADGSDAAALWFVRRRSLDKVEEAVARREAEELGPIDARRWEAALAYLEGLKPPPAPAPPPAPKVAAPEPTRPEPKAGPAMPEALGEVAVRDAISWKPLLAMVLTILAVPLAYWSRSGFSLGHPAPRPRASLPASAPQRRSLPPASGG